jgi:hypothetical protein
MGPFEKIAYFMALQDPAGKVQWVFISMDPFTGNAEHIGVPTASSGARFQQKLTNCSVKSNVESIKNGTYANGCNIEFWDCDYAPANKSKNSAALV